jgi:predicted amidohydrolase YtcJ
MGDVDRASRAVALVLVAWLAVACSGSPPADLIITGGMVWTGTSSGEASPGAVAIRGGKVVAVSESAEVARYAGRGTEIINAGGGLVMPGFADGHTHLFEGGVQLVSVDLRDAATPREFIRRLSEYAKRLKPGEWITGGDWDHQLWPGAPLPRRSWIDSVTPDNPVFVNRLDNHSGLANTAALRAAGVTRDTPAPSGGEIVRDARTGEPLGIFKDNAMQLILGAVPPPSAERRDSALARALAHAASLGVTATADMMATQEDLESYRRLRAAGRLTLRAYLYFPIAAWRAVAETVARSGTGDDWIKIAGVKAFADGSAGSRTAYFFEPFADSAGYAGLLRTSEADLRTLIGAVDSAGLQLAVHAIGDRANALLLQIYDSVAQAHGPRDRRFRVEHAQHLRPSEIPRFAEIRAVASMQPAHLVDDGRWLEQRIGAARSRWTYAFRSLIDAGTPLVFGSDWSAAPLDPLVGVSAAVTRRTGDGRHPGGWVPEEKITLGEALRAYTAGNAWAVFAEHRWGMLVPRYEADVVVLDRNLFAMPPESLTAARVQYTIVGGRTVFRRKAAGNVRD